MSTEIVSHETKSSVIAQYSDEQLSVITNHIAKGASKTELQYFLAVSKRLGLDPFGRQVYFIKRWDSKAKAEVGTVQVSIDGFRAIAARTGAHAGTDDVEFDKEDGEHPNKATATVYRFVRGVKVPFKATARWTEYVQTYFKDGKTLTSPMWVKMPWLMLGKCAEALALRKAFPEFLSGVYTHDEMSQADTEDRGLDDNGSPTTMNVTLTGKEPSKAKSETLFYLQMLLESVKAPPEEVGKWLKSTFGVETIGELTEEQAQEVTAKLEVKYADRIEKLPKDPEPPQTPPEGSGTVEATKDDKEPEPTPEKPPEAKTEAKDAIPVKRDWIKEAHDSQSYEDGLQIVTDMELAGESAFKTKTVMAVVKQKFSK